MANPDLTHMSLPDLQREILRRQRQLERRIKTLVEKRERLLSHVTEIESEIASAEVEIKANGGTPSVARKRPRNTSTLADALADMLNDQHMSVTEVSAAVQGAGYRTTSPNFRTIVNQTLLKDLRFKRVSRGRYTVRTKARKT
jgi:vacuolar-type H+-ATPase subunit D/Vma8